MTSKLEKIRVSRGLSQRRLEMLSGIKQQQISLIEKGKPIMNLNQAQRLAKALNCRPSELIDIDSGYDKLTESDLRNIHKFLQATFDLTGTNIRKAANLLNIDASELKDFEEETADLSVDDGLLLAFVSMFPFIAQKISTSIRQQNNLTTSDPREKEVLEAFRALSDAEKERFIHLIKATPLLK